MAAGIGLGKLVATCDEPPKDIGVGDAFDCRAKTREDGEIKFLATMATKDRVDVVTTNLITSQGMDKIEKVAVGIVDDKAGGSLGIENFDCGEGPMIFDPESDKLNCELTDPDNGDIYDTEVTLSDLSDGGKVSIKVADKPKK